MTYAMAKDPTDYYLVVMDKLPPELLTVVCSLCNIETLKNIRLVNRTLSDVAAPYLFEGLCVALFPKYLDNLTKVAQSPHLRPHVKTIYFGNYLIKSSYSSYEEWRA